MKNIHVGDKINMDGIKGIVVCSLDNDEYSKKYSKADWDYLVTGILVETNDMGLVHLEESKISTIEKNNL